MKYNNAQLQSFLNRPHDILKAFLVYGPDEGIIRETVLKLSALIVDDLKDPFRVVDLTPASFKENPSVLYDEAAAFSLMGGRKLIRIKEADETIVEPLSFLLDNYIGNSFVIISADNLNKTSKLRKLGEASEKMAAFACYADEFDTLKSIIQTTFKEEGISADYETVAFIASNLGADRGISRSEINKLVLYAGEKKSLSLDEAITLLGDTSAISFDDLNYAVADGLFLKADKVLQKIFREDDTAAVTIIRSLSSHFQRLLMMVAKKEEGETLDQAMKSLYPPVFYKRTDAFKKQIRIWKKSKIIQVLNMLIEAEKNCKKTGSSSYMVVGTVLIKISALAKHK